MGSTLVGAVVEKFGFLNIPVRKIGLHDYLIGKRSINDPFMFTRFRDIGISHGSPIRLGGVSVSDRDGAPPRALVDWSIIKDGLDSLTLDEHLDVSMRFDEMRNLYAKALVYKKSNHKKGWHIEYTTDLEKYHSTTMVEAYRNSFESVFFISLHRNFEEWVEAIVSQRFSHTTWKVRLKFVLSSITKQYREYEDSIKDVPGLHLDFDEIFAHKIQRLNEQIGSELGLTVPILDWENEMYDLYGKLSNFEKTFIKADFGGKYLSPVSRSIINFSAKKKRFIRIIDFVFYFFYLFDLVRFLKKRFFYRWRCRDG